MVCCEKAAIVVKDPKKPITKKKYKFDLSSEIWAIAMPMQKHPIKLTAIVPEGSMKK